MKKNKRVIILTGAHGTGKSYTGQIISTALGATLIDNVGCKWRRPYLLLQLYISGRYFLKMLWHVCIMRRVVVATRGYIDQSCYARVTGCGFTGFILEILAYIQALDKCVLFIHIPPTPELIERVASEDKWRPSGPVAAYVTDELRKYFTRIYSQAIVIDMPADIRIRETYLPQLIQFLKKIIIERKV